MNKETLGELEELAMELGIVFNYLPNYEYSLMFHSYMADSLGLWASFKEGTSLEVIRESVESKLKEQQEK